MNKNKKKADIAYQYYKKYKKEATELELKHKAVFEEWEKTMSPESAKEYDQIEKAKKDVERQMNLHANLIVKYLYEEEEADEMHEV